MKPLVVYVSGAPGSGKTTLAELLSEQLYIPKVSSDLVHGGVALSKSDHDRKQTLINVFIPLLVFMAEKRISFIVDHVLQKGQSEQNIIAKLRAHAEVVYIHTEASIPIDRYVERIKSSSQPSIVARREQLLGLAGPHEDNLQNTSHPLELGLPTLVVNTNHGYKPSLDQIISFIKASYLN